MGGAGICLALCVVGLVLFLRGRVLGVGVASALAVLAIGQSVGAQDFGAATSRAPVESIEADPMGWHVAATRGPVVTSQTQNSQTPARATATTNEILNWTPAVSRVSAEKGAPKPQVLVFVRAVGCSDCLKETKHLKENIEPLGWDVSADPDADFRIVDVLKEPRLAEKYAVSVVPTAIYVTETGRPVERQEGFVHRNWTLPLKALRSQHPL